MLEINTSKAILERVKIFLSSIKKRNELIVFEGFIDYLSYQLLQYLLNQTTHNKIQTPNISNQVDSIIRANELHTMTGLSRTTLWRMENKEEFPIRVSLGANSIGWRLSEIKSWMRGR